MPIACDLYSQLELAAMRKTLITLYRNETVIHHGMVKDLICINGEEFLVTESNQKILLTGANSLEIVPKKNLNDKNGKRPDFNRP